MIEKIKELIKKKNKRPIVCLTSYSFNISSILDKYCDLILVGDSVSNVLYGMKNTHKLTLEMIIEHTKSVKSKIAKNLLVVDMPKGTYGNSKLALKNAKKIIKETKCDAVKIENYRNNHKIIEKLVKSKINVMGHIGYTPQYKSKFKIQGNSKTSAKQLLKEAKLIEKAGAFCIVLECIETNISKKITEFLKIPTIGIGSSKYCDGQILVTDDILGLSGFYPRFVKKYVNIKKYIEKAIQKYSKEVLNKQFPKKKHSF